MTLIRPDLNDRSVRNKVLGSSVPDLAGQAPSVCVRGVEESVMLGVRCCLIIHRPGLSNCDWAHPPPSAEQGKSEKLKSHNQDFLRRRPSTPRTRAARGCVRQGHQPQVVAQTWHKSFHLSATPLIHIHGMLIPARTLWLTPSVQVQPAFAVDWFRLMSFTPPLCLPFTLNSSQFSSGCVYFLPVSDNNPQKSYQTPVRTSFILAVSGSVITAVQPRYLPLMCVFGVCSSPCVYFRLCGVTSVHVCLGLLIRPARSRH